jgi:hypothetical protein
MSVTRDHHIWAGAIALSVNVAMAERARPNSQPTPNPQDSSHSEKPPRMVRWDGAL